MNVNVGDIARIKPSSRHKFSGCVGSILAINGEYFTVSLGIGALLDVHYSEIQVWRD